ncbi:MAG: N-acetyltransferase family protein [Clostridium sp.]
MSEKFIVRKAEKNDIAEIQTLIKGLATYEKRPQDMTASQEDLCYWIFEKKIATVLIAEYNEEIIGYAIYYPIFGSFAAEARVHLEDVLLNEKYRHCGLGRKFFSKIEEFVKEDGYSKMEWSCLDWNTPSIRFYDKIGATQEQGRVYFSYNCKQI